MKLHLLAIDPELVKAWQQAFSGFDHVDIQLADFFSQPADLMISPANSFGFMDGGLDLAIRHELGVDIETRLREDIRRNYHGELPVGQAHILATGNTHWPYLACAPTMRVPMPIEGSLNVYYAFRAVLQAVNTFNQAQAESPIRNLLCPGMGTGIGCMPPEKAAGQMAFAWRQYQNPAETLSAHQVLEQHDALMRYV